MVVVALLLASCSRVVDVPQEQPAVQDLPPQIDEPDDGVVRIRGVLEDSETDTGRPGEVRAYRSNADGTYTLLDADTTDGAGNFALSFQDDAEVFDLQARLKDGAADASYVRTLTLPMQRASELLVRAVPYTGLNGDTVETDITIERFREFIIESIEDKHQGLRKWKQGEPKGIEVLHEYVPPPGPPGVPCTGWVCLPGSFTQDDLDAIEEVLRSEEGRALFGGRDVPIQIDGPSTPEEQKHYSYYEYGGGLARDDGWIIIYPSGYADHGILGAAGKGTYANSSYLRAGQVILKIDNQEVMAQAEKHQAGSFRSLVLHELGHASYARHTRTLRPLQSMMAPLVPDQGYCPSLCFADRKALKIVYEKTFPVGVRIGDVLLGLGWHD